jgi:hypothetical protein
MPIFMFTYIVIFILIIITLSGKIEAQKNPNYIIIAHRGRRRASTCSLGAKTFRICGALRFAAVVMASCVFYTFMCIYTILFRFVSSRRHDEVWQVGRCRILIGHYTTVCVCVYTFYNIYIYLPSR